MKHAQTIYVLSHWNPTEFETRVIKAFPTHEAATIWLTDVARADGLCNADWSCETDDEREWCLTHPNAEENEYWTLTATTLELDA